MFTLKTIYAFVIISVVIISCSENASGPTETIPDPVNYYLFDVKTEFSEKMDVTGAKNGLMAYIDKSEWADNQETGENYSVWIKNCTREINDTKITVEFDFELRTAAMFTHGDLIKSKRIKVKYDNKDWEEEGNINVKKINDSLEGVVNIAELIPGLSSITNYIELILGVLDNTMTQGETVNHKAEGTIVGAKCFYELKMWILEIED
ncbi:MAG: hypothetical protein ACLFQU_07725 [Candidatus Kapaibacterium sp.]